ncbi:MAG: uracil-DNA glycosylase [Oxalobacteraceae bacterium]|nr:uracil-DNA glycosylase [Oxalobacteraceae bacterium]
MTIPAAILDALAAAHASWQPILREGLQAVARADAGYLPALANSAYLPTDGRLFAAFTQPLDAVRYVLVGEGPYPRAASATGVCFMDGAVAGLWSDQPDGGLSKPVNKATSLRNFIKMLLVADGQLQPGHTSGAAMVSVAVRARAIGSPLVQTLADLQRNLLARGFLLLNAALVYRPEVAAARDARAWLPFLEVVLNALAARIDSDGVPMPAPTLVLWGKVAERLQPLRVIDAFPQALSEHPYNLSFIAHAQMQALFGPLHLLRK